MSVNPNKSPVCKPELREVQYNVHHLPEETEGNDLDSGTQEEYKTVERMSQSAQIHVVKQHRTNKLGNDAKNTICTKQRTYKNGNYRLIQR